MYCERPGTYMYHCHVEASEHVQMGMYGPMWIYPKQYGNVSTGGAAYNNSLTQFDQEVFMLMSEFDTRWHDSITWMCPVNISNRNLQTPFIPSPIHNPEPELHNFKIPDYRPNYWLINGRSLPDTVFAGKYNVNYQKACFYTELYCTLHMTTAQQLTYYPAATYFNPHRRRLRRNNTNRASICAKTAYSNLCSN